MKEKYEDLILRIVSKRYPYIKKIVFKTMVDDPDLTVFVCVDTDMIIVPNQKMMKTHRTMSITCSNTMEWGKKHVKKDLS
jgi:hypothetical protein